MPETLEPPVSQTVLQAEIAAKTAAAVQNTGLGKDFDMEVDAAIAKDSAAAAAKDGKIATAVVTPAPVKPASAKPADKSVPTLNIPETLLGEKKKAVEEPAKTALIDSDRQKFIEEMTKGMSVKAADRFRFVENEASVATQKAAQIEKEFNEFKARPPAAAPDNTELEKYKKQAGELDELVQRTNLAEHPKFKAHYDGGREKEIAAAKSVIADAKVAAEVEALLSMPETAQRNRRLNEIVGELEPIEAGKFQVAVDRADRLAAEKAQELTNWKANKERMAEMTQAEQKQTTEQRQRVIDTAYKAVEKKFSDPEKGVELFRKVDGNDEWNKSVDDRLANVRKLTEAELRPDDIAEMAAWAMSGAEYRKLFLSQRVLVQKLQQEIQSLKGEEPDLGESGGTGEEVEEGGMIDVVSRVAQKEGAVR